MAAHRRRKQTGAATLLEGGTLGGGAVGLLVASLHLTRHPIRTSHCPPAREAATCIGHATSLSVQPMVLGAAAGAILRLGLAVALVLLWRGLRGRRVASRV